MIEDSSTESWDLVADDWVIHADTNDHRLHTLHAFAVDHYFDRALMAGADYAAIPGGRFVPSRPLEDYMRPLAASGLRLDRFMESDVTDEELLRPIGSEKWHESRISCSCVGPNPDKSPPPALSAPPT